MTLNSYLIPLFIGVLVYLIMILDAKYIEPHDRPISPKIPLVVTLLVWLVCNFYKGESPVAYKPEIFTGGFYQ